MFLYREPKEDIMKDQKEVKVKSLQKALAILNCFVQKKSLGITEIANMMDLNKSNVHSILSTFKAMDYLEQDPESGKYHLGIGIFTLCRALGDSFNITLVAKPYLQELSNETNERVYLGIPNGDEVIYLDAMYPAESAYLMRTIMGERAKMYCTAIGKSMMAYMPREQIEEYAEQDMIAYTEKTITEKDVLLKNLEITKARGYAIDDMEHEFGVRCVAMPIINRHGTVEAAVSISGPSLRFSDEKIPELAAMLEKTVRKIEMRL